MKDLILCSTLYSDIDRLCALIASMEYEDNIHGAEIANFNFIPSELAENFRHVLSLNLEVQPNTGVFRKPYANVHCELFYQHAEWLCIVAFEDTTLTLWKQENVKSFFDIEPENLDNFIANNCQHQHKWTVMHQLNMKKNDFVFIRPWIWYSLTETKLVQLFLLNQRLDQEV